MKASHCDQCLYFRWGESKRCQICDKEHKPRWYMPTSNPHNPDWGWKRVCTDFEKKVKKMIKLPLPPPAGHDAMKGVRLYTQDQMHAYGALCRKMALEEAHAWMLQRHDAQKHRDNYMMVEANRFAKENLK